MQLSNLKDKKILVLGLGREGIDNYLALRKLFPQKTIGIADKLKFEEFSPRAQKFLRNDKKLKLHLGEDYLKNLRLYDLILKTPGIPLRNLKRFLKKGAKITSQTKIFFDNFKGTIIGVTGTKGKGTTASLIYQILKKAGFKAHLVGNIGQPAFQLLLRTGKGRLASPNFASQNLGRGQDIFVYELSSHQLQDMKKSPQIAVFLNFFPDHLDYYKDLKEYQRAKENITLHQTKKDYFIYNVDDKTARVLAQKTKARKIPFCLKKKRELASIVKIKEIPLKGNFNLLNLMAAVKAGELLNISNKEMKKAIKSFKPLPHRLNFIGRYRGIEFYDDSMSTIPEVTIAALKALAGKVNPGTQRGPALPTGAPKAPCPRYGAGVKTLILGGSDKGSDYQELAKEILKHNLKTLIMLSPGTGEKIWQWLQKIRKNNLPQLFFVSSMREAVKIAYERTNKGGVCLLSPGAASFNLFRDYQERGNLFRKYVKAYASR